MGTYDTDIAKGFTLKKLKANMRKYGVENLYCKPLSPNDNSKNQPYFGENLTALNMLPTGHTTVEVSASKKPGAPGTKRFKSEMNLLWLTPDNQLIPAPEAKLIFYPQYPEARFSGFLKGSRVELSEWMDPGKQGRAVGRYLFLGTCKDKRIIGFFATPDSALAREMNAIRNQFESVGVFLEIPLTIAAADTKGPLLEKLKQIHDMGWINSTRLDNTGAMLPCNSPNCGGYTLEAMLGIIPNGNAEPDYLGWEIKQYGVSSMNALQNKAITLMTPEPSGGFYKASGVPAFIRRFGYPDKNGIADRLNFGGIHKWGTVSALTGLQLALPGYDIAAGKIKDPEGGIALITQEGEYAALWGFSKLIDHWKRKHTKAAYIPSLSKDDGSRQYSYGNKIKLCTGTDFIHVLKAIQQGNIYYDPGLKLENAMSPKPVTKRRSQFRTKSGLLDALYDSTETVELA